MENIDLYLSYYYGTSLSYLNQCDKQVRSKSTLIILPKMCYVMDYVLITIFVE